MAINFEATQLVVGAALLDRRYRRALLQDRGRALSAVHTQPCAPNVPPLSVEDRLALGSIRASSLREFALGVERLRAGTRAAQAQPARGGLADLAG
jgi:hypothetical protein